MPYTHVFVTHAVLQEYLTEGIIRQESIDPARVLALRVRGSYRVDENAAYTILNGGDYSNVNGRNLLKHRRTNKQRYLRFKADVLDQLAPGFQIYSPMYTYWYLNVLASRASAYHVLEDGFGSFQTLEELSRYFDRMTPKNWKERLANWQMKALLLPGQRDTPGRTIKMLDGVGKCYATLAGCFPWKAEKDRVVVSDVFPPSHQNEFDDAWLMATSCLVEAGVVSLPDYLEVLREVFKRITDRGIKVLHLKLHPTQAGHPTHVLAYRGVFAEFADRIEVRELPQHYSIECIAAGSRIRFITGISTLGFHVAVTGAEVYRYQEIIDDIVPGFSDYLPRKGVEEFHHLTRPL